MAISPDVTAPCVNQFELKPNGSSLARHSNSELDVFDKIINFLPQQCNSLMLSIAPFIAISPLCITPH